MNAIYALKKNALKHTQTKDYICHSHNSWLLNVAQNNVSKYHNNALSLQHVE